MNGCPAKLVGSTVEEGPRVLSHPTIRCGGSRRISMDGKRIKGILPKSGSCNKGLSYGMFLTIILG
jgi:hypothetical protein